jgi:IS5 family transposase
LKYEVALSIGNPRIIWVSGPHKNSHDATIARSSQILTNLVEGEKLMADKAYRGDEIHFICPLSGSKRNLPREDRARNYMIYSVRSAVERIIRRVKVFGFLRMEWRFSVDLHALCFRVACKLVNLFLIFEGLNKN